MKINSILIAAAVIAFATSTSMAQPPQGGPPGGPGGPGGHDGPPPGGHPIVEALDADRNHELSTDEINNAVKALKGLDKNGDGVLNEEDFGSMGGRRGGGPPGGGQGGARGGRGGGPPGGGPGGPGQRGGGGDTSSQASDFASRLMAFDKNDDGKIEKDELPKRMQRVMDNIDSNSDGVLDKSELDKLRASASESSSQARGDRGDRGREAGGGPPGGRGNRGGAREGRGERGGPGGGGPGGPDQMIDMAFEFDKDGDGKLSREELTEFASSMSRRGGPGGRGGQRGGPPGGGRQGPPRGQR